MFVCFGLFNLALLGCWFLDVCVVVSLKKVVSFVFKSGFSHRKLFKVIGYMKTDDKTKEE